MLIIFPFLLQFDLVCERAFQAWLANSMLFFGWALGAMVLGIVSDKYGRRKVLFPSLLIVSRDCVFCHGVCKRVLDRRRLSSCHRVFRGWMLYLIVRVGD